MDFENSAINCLPKTLKGLKKIGWHSKTVKEEIKDNLIKRLQQKKSIFTNIFGYEKTVEQQIINALLSQHNFILLGLRGQGKTKIIREIKNLLDTFSPCISGLALNENPLNPISPQGKKVLAEMGDDMPIEWRTQEDRYKEKLATPDVSIADLIGDIDPIKAAREKLDISNENVIHWGIVPRSNRGIFAINELPDLQPRIQVGLFNILEENDIQVRGFPLRVPMDILLLFSANPEDYTNRGRIITPLKDRINSQIITHYPSSIKISQQITQSEVRKVGDVAMPPLLAWIVEQITVTSRHSDLIDPLSGVSQRLSIAAYETVLANAMRRFLVNPKGCEQLRIMDLYAAVSAITGKIELIEEHSQEDLMQLGTALIGDAIKETFVKIFPSLGKNAMRRLHQSIDDEEGTSLGESFDVRYMPLVDYFKKGGKLSLSDDMPDEEYYKAIFQLPGVSMFIENLIKKGDKKDGDEDNLLANIKTKEDINLLGELLMEGLYEHHLISRTVKDGHVIFQDVYSSMFSELI